MPKELKQDDRKFKKLVREISTDLMDQMDCGDGMAEVEMAQDAQDEVTSVAVDLLKKLGYTEESPVYNDILEAAVSSIRFVPAHWEYTRRKR